jgi:hypothetical protein
VRFEEIFHNLLILFNIFFIVENRLNECVAGSYTISFEFLDARQLTEMQREVVSCFETGNFRFDLPRQQKATPAFAGMDECANAWPACPDARRGMSPHSGVKKGATGYARGAPQAVMGLACG